MEYDVLEESRHATDNLEKNAWSNHKEQYLNTKALVEDFNDRIDVLELKQQEAKTQEEKDKIQDDLTKIIDEILSVNEDFGTSMMVVDAPEAPANPDDLFTINYDEIFADFE